MPFRTLHDGSQEYEPMPGRELSAIRHAFGLKKLQMGKLIGYTGEDRNIYMTVKRFESGAREIPPYIERLLLFLRWFYQDHGYLPDLDNASRAPMAAPQENANA